MIKRKRFITKIASLLAVLLMLCPLFTLTACTTYTSELEGDYVIGYSKFKNEAFIDCYYWQGKLGEDMDIVLPNTYKDAPVTTLGGYIGTGYPCPFTINFFEKSGLKNELFGDSDTWSYSFCSVNADTQEEVYTDVKAQLNTNKEIEIKDIVFNLYIGSNLQKIEIVEYIPAKYFAFDDSDENEVLTVYAFSFVVTVDEKNEYFYSDDLGRMYYKEDNKLVELFLYHNRESFPEYSLPQNKV